jgi:hypothetical protein
VRDTVPPVSVTPPPSQEAIDAIVRRELAREGVTMALYVSLTLLTALIAIPSEDVPGSLGTAAVIWGGAAGLALAHWLAFDIAARLYSTEHLDRLHRLGGPVTLAAALAVALVASIPIVFAPDDIATELAVCVLSGILGLAGFGVGRRSGAGLLRSLAGGLIVLGVAGVVVAIKIAIDH